ncbi:MAG: hypothetical protein WB780_05860, partial [Candidatus Acidiferrales bacterium]
VTALKIQELANFLTPFMTSSNSQISPDQKRAFSQLIFDSNNGYHDVIKNEQAKAILPSLEVGRIYSSVELGNLVTAFNSAPQFAHIATNPAFMSLHDFLVRILAVTKTCAKFLGENGPDGVPAEPPATQPNAVLDLLVIDFDKTGIDIKRLEELFATLDHLREQLTILLQLRESHLRIRYIESGFDIRISLEGLTDAIDGIRTIWNDIWTKIADREFDKIDRRNFTIGGNFKLIDSIEERVKAGTITREDGEHFKLAIMKDAFKLLDSGTMLTATPATEPVDNRKLLGEARSAKLLTTGEPAEREKE